MIKNGEKSWLMLYSGNELRPGFLVFVELLYNAVFLCMLWAGIRNTSSKWAISGSLSKVETFSDSLDVDALFQLFLTKVSEWTLSFFAFAFFLLL